MSKNLERVIQRAISDAAFRRQLQSNPEAAVRGLNLTQAEVAALRSGDASKLTSLGIDQRMSKTFTFGGDSLASRSSIGGDLTSGAGMSLADRSAGGVNSAIDSENVSGAARTVIPTDPSGSTPAFDPGTGSGSTSVGDPMAESSTASHIGDPDNPASARGYTGQAASTSDAMEDQSHGFAATRSADVGGSTIGYSANYPEHGGLAGQSADQASSARGSVIGDPDNPASARTFTGGQASTSDAMEDQSHAFAATRSADVAAAGQAAPIEGSPEEFAFRDQGATASSLSDPDNPAAARGYIGGQAASASDAIEDQSHAFAATRSADVAAAGQAAPIEGSPEEFAFRDQGATASSLSDPDNPAAARGYIGGQTAPTSDAIEDQSHAIAANRSDAFLSEGEVSQYADPSLSTGQALDEGQLTSPNAGDTIPDDADTVSARHEPDIPS
jgi:hypothetical protein